MTNVKEKSLEELQQAESAEQAMPQTQPAVPEEAKYCKHCGKQIPKDAVLCVHCGRQVEELSGGAAQQPNIVINNNNTNQNTNTNIAAVTIPPAAVSLRTARNKWIAVLLCLFLGYVGGHKFYEGKAGMGVLYIFTVGLFGIGWLADLIVLLQKPNPYYV